MYVWSVTSDRMPCLNRCNGEVSCDLVMSSLVNFMLGVARLFYKYYKKVGLSNLRVMQSCQKRVTV